jgi:glyoxylase-like metal-dependent hydrolase (beta-lactamase superfamily II)
MDPAEISVIAEFLVERNVSPQVIVLTHSHWDHILGPERFPGVKTVAQANYLAEVSGKNSARIIRQITDWEAENNIERSHEQSFRIPYPDEMFSENTSLTVADEISLTLVHAPGHAADQLVVYHPQSTTLWASDILSDLEIPFVSDSLAAYEQTLVMLSKWEIGVLVPGHGHSTIDPAEIDGRLSHDLEYLSELREEISGAIRQGITVEETVKLCAGMVYRYPEENRGAHRLNVESIYLELGGEADPAAVGWNQTK